MERGASPLTTATMVGRQLETGKGPSSRSRTSLWMECVVEGRTAYDWSRRGVMNVRE